MRQSACARLLTLLTVAILVTGCAATPRRVAPAALTIQPTAQVAPSPLATLEQPPTAQVVPSPPVALEQPPAALPAVGEPVLGFRVVNSYPHDPLAFTQGLVYRDGERFFEGTGLNGASSLRAVELQSGAVEALLPLEAEHFGEGIAVVGEWIFQLTWQSRRGFIYRFADGAFSRVGEFSYPPPGRQLPVEGWGLTFDGTRLIMSDGTANLYFIDPEETIRSGVLTITGQLAVRSSAGPLIWLNELEYINGAVYANIWQSERIARIDPATGRVTAYIDLSDLRRLLPPDEYGPFPPEVLNGIAYDAAGDRLFVTGKRWPRLFEIDLVEPAAWRVYLPLAHRA